MKLLTILFMVLNSLNLSANPNPLIPSEKNQAEKQAKKQIDKKADKKTDKKIAKKNNKKSPTRQAKILPATKTEVKPIAVEKIDCLKMEKKFERALLPQAEECVFKQKVNDENLRFFVGVAFYHTDEKVRQEAFNKLDTFSCGPKTSCQEFYKIIEKNESISAMTDKNILPHLAARANSLKEKALAKINKL